MRIIAGRGGIVVVALIVTAFAATQLASQEKPILAEQVFKNVQVLKGIPVDDFLGTMGIMAAALQFDCSISPPLKGYRRIAWVVGSLDDAHWDPTPETAREPNFAKYFRQENPTAAIRVLLIDAPVTHYAHIERPRQLAAVLIGAVRWVMQ